MNRKPVLATAVLGGIALAAVGCAKTVTASVAPHSAAPASSSAPAAPPTTQPPAAPVANPKATGQGSCSYNLASSISGNDYLTGEVDLNNTGNVGVDVTVSVAWPQEGFSPIVSTKQVKLPFGASGQVVSFHVNAGNAGTSNVINNLQSWEQGHNYPSDDCTYKIDITGMTGAVH
jgi:hypothetical protein